jgi:drug/metabolite transporter (DMT)-like permease
VSQAATGTARVGPSVVMPRRRGTAFALLSTVFFGTAPIFGKLAYRAQVSPFTLVALRTVIAAAMLWLLYLVFWRDAVRISWSNLLGCVGMGIANGLGSLLYYSGLSRIDASLAQLLYTLYPIWVFVFLISAGHHVSGRAWLRLLFALTGVFALTYTGARGVDLLGVMLLISSGACYGWHLVLGQWTLADADSRTVTLYVLTTMALVVLTARLVDGTPWQTLSTEGWLAVLGLTLLPTILARLLVFAGLRDLGGAQTSLLGLAELLVALLIAYFVLGERLGSRESTLEVSWEDLLREGRWRELN